MSKLSKKKKELLERFEESCLVIKKKYWTHEFIMQGRFSTRKARLKKSFKDIATPHFQKKVYNSGSIEFPLVVISDVCEDAGIEILDVLAIRKKRKRGW